MTMTAQLTSSINNIDFSLGRTFSDSVNTSSDFDFPAIAFSAQPEIAYYGYQASLSFNIRSEFTTSYALIRGLIEFTRSQYLKFSFDNKKRSIQIELNVVHLPELVILLQNVDAQLARELGFKASLKKAIAFEKRYREACAGVYGFSAATHSL